MICRAHGGQLVGGTETGGECFRERCVVRWPSIGQATTSRSVRVGCDPGATSFESRITNFKSQAANFNSRAARFESRPTHFKSRATYFESEAASHPIQAANFESRVTNFNSRAARFDSRTRNSNPPTANPQPLTPPPRPPLRAEAPAAVPSSSCTSDTRCSPETAPSAPFAAASACRSPGT